MVFTWCSHGAMPISFFFFWHLSMFLLPLSFCICYFFFFVVVVYYNTTGMREYWNAHWRQLVLSCQLFQLFQLFQLWRLLQLLLQLWKKNCWAVFLASSTPKQAVVRLLTKANKSASFGRQWTTKWTNTTSEWLNKTAMPATSSDNGYRRRDRKSVG